MTVSQEASSIRDMIRMSRMGMNPGLDFPVGILAGKNTGTFSFASRSLGPHTTLASTVQESPPVPCVMASRGLSRAGSGADKLQPAPPLTRTGLGAAELLDRSSGAVAIASIARKEKR